MAVWNEREYERLRDEVQTCKGVIFLFARDLIAAKGARARRQVTELIERQIAALDAAEKAVDDYIASVLEEHAAL